MLLLHSVVSCNAIEVLHFEYPEYYGLSKESHVKLRPYVPVFIVTNVHVQKILVKILMEL